MSFGQDFLQGFFGSDGLKDYAHASKTFRTNGYELAPRHKYLFHVYFTINVEQIPALAANFGTGDSATLGLLVKTIALPNYTLKVDTLNQYNRSRLVQSKIEYQPVRMTLHDDGADRVRNMWYNYFSYYYKDPTQRYGSVANTNGSISPSLDTPSSFSYNARDIYDNDRPVNDWGYVGESFSDNGASCGPGFSAPGSKPPFFRDIKIFGLNQHRYAAYVLVNPMITEFQHDTYDYSAGGGVMEHTATIKYETVKYYTGAIGKSRPDTNVIGFAGQEHYDQTRSSISRPGSVGTVLGQGGLLDAGIGIIEDLQSGGPAGVLGAIQKAGTAYNTFKGKNLKSIVTNDVKSSAPTIIKQVLPGAVRGAIGTTGATPPTSPGTLNTVFFPTPPRAK